MSVRTNQGVTQHCLPQNTYFESADILRQTRVIMVRDVAVVNYFFNIFFILEVTAVSSDEWRQESEDHG